MKHHILDNFGLGLSHTAISLPRNVVAAKMEYTQIVSSQNLSKRGLILARDQIQRQIFFGSICPIRPDFGPKNLLKSSILKVRSWAHLLNLEIGNFFIFSILLYHFMPLISFYGLFFLMLSGVTERV